ncbi:hypothetical protein [Roseimaritima ulvae]|uniref:Uncharacterized protein n=1 Tax=Roseimaritima ulvae TaxID=980254 RepID=A0A5B9QWT5_9BACT|nr:hypothetical protein [Roseimaritima ulvae]QEG42369.1 hypothetical protein UC8_44030 [Roseimaritima ulvae]
MSDTELFNPASFDAPALLAIAALALLLVVAWFLVVGYSMKFSLSIVGAGRFGFWKSILIVLLAGGSSSIISTTLMMISPGDPFMALLSLVAAVIAYCLVISLVAQCSFGKGFLTYLLNGCFNLLGAIPVVILLFVGLIGVRQMVDPEGLKMDRLKMDMAQVQATGEGADLGDLDLTAINNAAAGETAGGVATPNRTQASRSGSQALPQRLPPVVDQSSSGSGSGGFFGWGAKAADKPYPGFDVGGECRSGCAKNRATPTKPPAVPLSPSSPQANPFAN